MEQILFSGGPMDGASKAYPWPIGSEIMLPVMDAESHTPENLVYRDSGLTVQGCRIFVYDAQRRGWE